MSEYRESGLSESEAFELHDLLSNLTGVRLLLAGLDVPQAANALCRDEVFILLDWQCFRAINELFPGFDKHSRHRDEKRLYQAIGVLDRELASSRKNRREVRIIRDAIKRLIGDHTEPRPKKQRITAETLQDPKGRLSQRRIPPRPASCGLHPVIVHIANPAEN